MDPYVSKPIHLLYLLILVSEDSPDDTDRHAEHRQQQHSHLWPLVAVRQVIFWDSAMHTKERKGVCSLDEFIK